MVRIDENNNMSIVRADSESFVCTVKDSSGVIVPLTDYTMKFTVKEIDDYSNNNDKAIIGPITAVIDDPLTGQGEITMTAEETAQDSGKYKYDVQISKTGNTSVHTVNRGDFTIDEDVTKNP